MKILALDYGTKRIGYAVSDPDRTVAFARESFEAEPQVDAIQQVKNIIAEEGIGEIVIGAPLGEENEETPMSQRAREFGAQIQEATGITPHFIDESGSSDEALSKIPLRKDRRDKSLLNAFAAQVILERYMSCL
ncbi:Holliday junction resolvase RuvX [Candidatus Peregrinibacteria bacterium CG11_big_fil_rev_8_21_14_0_20_46_8]|nr:MAG: Holliday junction resolvase RuvX [Candidatus Peregrinibacteria bacterium CG11_big_fil_rev_8_21_14_0_20_46_8]